MISKEEILAVLGTIPDPEMPISIVELGLIEDIRIAPDGDNAGIGDTVVIDVLPTFVGCPALDMIRNDIVTKVGAIPGVGAVNVAFIYDPPWTVDRITSEGRAELAAHGVTVPASHAEATAPTGALPGAVPLRTSAVACPFCGSSSTRLDSPFGPTRCRMIYYCESCRNGFEHMKRLSPVRPASSAPVVPAPRP